MNKSIIIIAAFLMLAPLAIAEENNSYSSNSLRCGRAANDYIAINGNLKLLAEMTVTEKRQLLRDCIRTRKENRESDLYFLYALFSLLMFAALIGAMASMDRIPFMRKRK